MKVLFVSSGNSREGISPIIKSQGESLIKNGIEVDFFTIKGKGVRGYLKNISRLRNQLKLNNYDIIHAHYGLVGMLCVLTLTRIPIVLSVMGDDAYGSYDFNGKIIRTSYFMMMITQIALFFVTQIIVKSENILKKIPHKKKCHVIPNGVNFEVFKPNGTKLKKNIVLVLVNIEDPRKNFKLLARALELINEPNVKLINPYPISHNQFPQFLNDASVFVLTSYNEGSPNVIKEAMACNIPIVSTDVGDVRTLIGNTEGCYVTSFEPEDVAAKIQLALAYNKRTTGRVDIRHLESGEIVKRIIDIYKIIKEN